MSKMNRSDSALSIVGGSGLDTGVWLLLCKGLWMKVCHNYLAFGSRKLTGYLTGIPITTPDFWVNEAECTDEVLRHVFRSATNEEIPLLEERVQCLREAGDVLCNVRPMLNQCLYASLTHL